MKSRLLIIVVMLMMVITITTNHVFAMCAYDPTNPHKPCDDLRAMLIIESHETQLENIDGKLYHVIGPFTLQSQSEDAIRLGDTEFTYPYYPVPIPPGGVMTVEITFSDGTKESIGRVGPPTPFIEFTDHDDPKAGVKRNSGGTFNFLLSVETNSILPLKQLKLGIPFDEIQCKDDLILVQKYDGFPACVSESTKQKLIERGWAKTNGIQIRNPVSTSALPDPMSIMINGNDIPLTIPIKAGETKEINVLLNPKIPIISSTIDVKSYFGSAGKCDDIDADSYCPGRGIEMHLSDTSVTSQKELLLTIIIPNNMTGGTYSYRINTDTLFESTDHDKLRTVGKSLRFDLKVENEN